MRKLLAENAALRKQLERKNREHDAVVKYNLELVDELAAANERAQKAEAERDGLWEAVSCEGELSGSMPDEVYNKTKMLLGVDFNREAMTEILRATVRKTKQNILVKIAALAAGREEGKP